MHAWTYIAVIVVACIAAPILAYAIVKFGTAGFYQAKRRERNKQEQKENKHE